MKRKYLMMAAVTTALAGPMIAHAQQSDQPQTAPMPADAGAAPPSAAMPATQAGTPAAATTDATGAQVVSNGPVPDTPANRAKYGRPMSRAGRHTQPAGN